MKNLQRDVQKAALSSLSSQTSADSSSPLGWAPPHCQSVATGRSWVCTKARNHFKHLCGNTYPIALQAASHRNGGVAFLCHLEVVCVPPAVCTPVWKALLWTRSLAQGSSGCHTAAMETPHPTLHPERMKTLQSSCITVCETSYLMSNSLNLP